jgi:hypothetical protein
MMVCCFIIDGTPEPYGLEDDFVPRSAAQQSRRNRSPSDSNHWSVPLPRILSSMHLALVNRERAKTWSADTYVGKPSALVGPSTSFVSDAEARRRRVPLQRAYPDCISYRQHLRFRTTFEPKSLDTVCRMHSALARLEIAQPSCLNSFRTVTPCLSTPSILNAKATSDARACEQ